MSRPWRRTGRFLATVLWFRISGGWIYYAILAAYAVLIAASVWLLSRPGWLSVIGALTILIDGFAITLFVLHRWLERRLRQPPPT